MAFKLNLQKKIAKIVIQYANLPSMIWVVNNLLRFVTLNVDNRQKTPISFGFYLVTISCVVCYYYAYQFSLLWFVFWRKPQRGDLGATIVYGSLSISSLIAIVKLFYMLMNKSKVRCLVDQCLESDALSEPNTRFSRSMAKLLRKVEMRAALIWTSLMVNSILYVTTPMFLPGKHLPEDLLVFYGLEPMFETPHFQISYAMMFFCVIFICYLTGTITAFVIIIIGYTEAQLRSLSKEILSLWEDSIKDTIKFKINYICALSENKVATVDNDTVIQVNKGVKRRLIQIVRNHSRNIALLKNINKFFDVPNAVAFGCLAVSLIAELLGGLENTFLQIPFTFVQVAIDCYIGQKIMDAGIEFERAVYFCKWEKFDKDNMKIVLLMLQNSQKTQMMSAGGMTVLNYSFLMYIVRSVYSTYTTFRSMI